MENYANYINKLNASIETARSMGLKGEIRGLLSKIAQSREWRTWDLKDCEHRKESLGDYALGILTPDQVPQIETHIESCNPCFVYSELERLDFEKFEKSYNPRTEPSKKAKKAWGKFQDEIKE